MTPRERRRQNAPAYSPSDEDRAVLKLLDQRFRPDDLVRLRNEQQWDINRAFLAGMQYLDFDPLTRQLGFSQSPSLRWRSRMPFNICRGFIRQSIATIGNFRPEFKCRPASTDPEDLQAANVARKVLESYWERLDMPRKKWEILHWLKVCGNAFWTSYWDPAGGEPIHDTKTILGPDGQPQQVTDLLYEGDMDTEVLSPYWVFGDNNASTPSEWRYWIDARARQMDWVEQHFPDKAHLVPYGVSTYANWNKNRWFMQRDAIFGGQDQSYDTWRDWCYVRKLTEKASMDYPRGRLIIEANGVVLLSTDNPHPRAGLGLVWLRNNMIPGILWAQSDMEDMLPIQRTYNRVQNKEVEHVVYTANSKLLEHATNELPETALNTEIGERVRWNGMHPPEWLAPPALPNSIPDLKGSLLQDMDRVNSTYGAERGQYQGKISGKAYMSLIEQGIQTKTPLVESLAIAFAEWGKDVLEWAQAYILEDRLIKFVGRGQQFDVMAFKGADLRGNTDITIDVDSMMPKSKALGLELLAALAPGQVWLNAQNPEDAARVWRMLGMEDDTRLVEDKNEALRQALIENREMFLGKVIPPAQAEEDQEVHGFAHRMAKNSDEYKNAEPIIKAIIDAHIYSHNQLNMPLAGVTVPMLPPQPMPEETSVEGPEPRPRGGGESQQRPPQRSRPAMRSFE